MFKQICVQRCLKIKQWFELSAAKSSAVGKLCVINYIRAPDPVVFEFPNQGTFSPPFIVFMVNSVPISTLLSLARYNRWAYKRVLDDLKSVSDEHYYGHAGLVFRSIHGTLNHLYAADITW